MSYQTHDQRSFDSKVGGGRTTTSHTAPLTLPASRPAFPGLGDIIGLVDHALQLRCAAAATARIRERLPTFMRRARAELPADLLRADECGHRRVELHRSVVHGYQILAMVWGPGQGTPIHDHHELWGVEAVVLGELQVVRYRIREVSGAALRLEPTQVVELRDGDVELIASDRNLHLCRNPSSRATTVSLHVYRQPLEDFGIYVDDGDGWYGRRQHCPRIEAATS